MLAAAEGTIHQWKADVLVPVPADRKRERERGYNQAALLARKLSEGSGIPVREDLVRRDLHTRPQNGLDPIQRKINLAGAFSCQSGSAVPERIILIDDIVTTGSTLDALSRCLKEAGARKVYALCLCAD